MTGARAQADEALAQVGADPRAALRLAESALAVAGADAAAAATAERALGLAHRHLRDLASSTEHFTRAIEIASAAGLREIAGQARLSMSGNLAEAGRFDDAIATADRAAADLDGFDSARATLQKATIHMVRGDWAGAVAGFGAALAGIEAAGASVSLANLHANRGMVHLRQGDLLRAERDMHAACELYERLGSRRRAADVLKNLGMVATARGDLPLALARYHEADAILTDLGISDPMGLLHRAHGLLGARLVEEARQAAEAAVRGFEAEGAEARLVEARLYLADVRLAAGDPAGARQEVAAARALMAGQRRPAFAPLADYADLRARLAGEPLRRGMLRMARSAADRLHRTGWTLESADARLAAARVAAAVGDVDAARSELDEAAWARRRGPAWLQIAAWHAEAATRLASGDTRGARAALRAGLRRVDRHQATLGASDMRARASELGAALAALGLRLAVESGRLPAIFDWAERSRANALDLRPTRPPGDERLAAAMGELRAAAAQAGRPGPPGADADRLHRRQHRLEAEVTSLLRHAVGGDTLIGPTPQLAGVRRRLDGTVLVEYLESEGRLFALVVTSTRARLVRLGDAAPDDSTADQLRLTALRVARPASSASAKAAAANLFESRAAELDAALLAPLRPHIGMRRVVVVPTGALHIVPWAALPTLAGRPVTVAPSAALWLRAGRRRRSGPVVLAAGPGLDHAAAEVTAVAPLYPGAVVLTGREATADAVLAAMDGSRLVHLAVHGRFRADNPLFSALVAHGGNVHMCDIERLARAPDVVVLSACEAALAGRFAGDELMGLAAAFLGLGTRTVVASTLPVSDRDTRRLMVRFHELLATDREPAVALAAAQQQIGGDSPAAKVTAGSFMCLGRR